MEGIEYFYELYESLPRCGPGASEATRRAYDTLADLPVHPLILDIGCGTGAQTVELAKVSNGKIIFVSRMAKKFLSAHGQSVTTNEREIQG